MPLRPGSRLDGLVSGATLFTYSMPDFVVGNVFIMVIALQLGLAPAVLLIGKNAPAAEILAVLHDNAAAARVVLEAALPLVPVGDLPENAALAAALLTPLEDVPASTRRRLAPLLRKYLPGR